MGELVDAAMVFRDRLLMGWTKGANARDTRGQPVHVSYPEAVAWCLSGAELTIFPWARLPRVSSKTQARLRDFISAEIGVEDENYRRAWQDWNDRHDRTHADVLAAADGVVRRAKEWEESHR